MSDPDVVPLPLPDARARGRIGRDLDVNLLVEAGAGSGKTTALVGRMVALLETDTARVEEIAAVTFTRKAAGELRERFQADLEARLAQLRGTEGESEASERLGRALDDIDRAFVGTIHAFCARLLRERPLEVGLDPAFEELAAEERLTLRRRFWGSYLERLTRENDPMLEELADSGLRSMELYGLFERIVENPDVDFPTDDVAAPGGAELDETRAELEQLVARGWELMPEHEPTPEWDPLQKKLRTLHFEQSVRSWDDRVAFFEAVERMCTSAVRGHKIVQKRWRERDLAKDLKKQADAFGSGQTRARELLDRWYTHRYALSVRLAGHAARAFAAHRRRLGKLDFQDLLMLAAELLREDPDVRRQLGGRYRRLLIDEFQDTDPLQAEIVLLLASEPSEEDAATELVGDWRSAVPRPGALFVVGDPKQSIYRFRRADIQLYGFVKQRFRDFGDVVELTTNFRSRPGIGTVVNEVFSSEGFFPESETPEQAAFELLATRPATEPVPEEGVFTYDLEPAHKNQAAASVDDAARLASWIRMRVDARERAPGDFLVLTRTKARLATYARALEEHGIPVQVTGAGVGVEEELHELIVLLECMIDPSNPVRVLSALVGLFFGMDYERLVDHRLAGGSLDAMKPREEGHPDVLAPLAVLHRWWTDATALPADVFVTGLASELGLLPFSASGELGALRAGALVFTMDAVRSAALAGDASLPGALSALRSALELPESEAPLEPGRPGVVRLMNLHQAKGLEASVVVLADPSAPGPRDPEMHVARESDGSARAYARVARAERWGTVPLALPPGWAEKEPAEATFEAAEEVRLLYVAVTRAREELVVVRWRDKDDSSPWHGLHPWLDEHATALALSPAPPPPRAEIGQSVEALRDATTAAERRLVELARPGYLHRSVTELAKSGGPAPETTKPEGPVDPTGYRGFSWGSAVHGALAVAATEPGGEALAATCRALLVEHGRPLDDQGEPVELEELLGLVEAVRSSELWVRAQAAERVLAEVPFACRFEGHGPVIQEPEPGPDGRVVPQMDLFQGEASVELSEPPVGNDRDDGPAATVLEGVIDLAFLEGGGWVIADYKTDVGTDPDFRRREVAYRRQVELYAEAWSRLSGDPVKERVLFFTAQGRTESW